ncbi:MULTISPECIES: hypothetical protein [Streptomyces]|uniref:hypothetical protein n=1 Tax=Streptomyces TaxID=1883 RepID=UPI003428DEF0
MQLRESGGLVVERPALLLPGGEVLQGLQWYDVGDEGVGGELVVDADAVVPAVVDDQRQDDVSGSGP